MQFYQSTAEQLYQQFNSSEKGLTAEQARIHLKKYGPNLLAIKGVPWWKKLIQPFLNVFMAILAMAGIVSAMTGEHLDAIIIGIILLITAAIDYVQQYSTERIFRALKKFETFQVDVWRDQKLTKISSEKLVPGDVIELREGQKVPADVRILDASNVRSDESLLTGESAPVGKKPAVIAKETPVYEQSNMLFSGAFLVSGEVQALVVATGNSTEFGRLADLTQYNEISSPVQSKIDRLITHITYGVAGLSILILVLSIYRGIELDETIRFVLTLAVAAVPEGLPVAISVVLVLGARRLAKHKALVRNMAAMENIGIVTTIATDKTGTLTQNKLSVQSTWLLSSTSVKLLPEAIFRSANRNNGNTHDPLDTAMIEHGLRELGTLKLDIDPVESYPFNQQLAMSGNAWSEPAGHRLTIKGAPEKLFDLCKLTGKQRNLAEEKLLEFTGRGLRVIALAEATLKKQPDANLANMMNASWKFIGFIGVADSLRPEAEQAVRQTQSAGVEVRMITGDHFETAYAIGKKLGLANSREEVFDCRQMNLLSQSELESAVENSKVFSRVLPEYKHKILDILKKRHITAMTGDGVNDVPALTNAHIGVAMGSGSQIAKEAGDIVLLDDNFASIVNALKLGRTVFDNIQRMLAYLLATNTGEVLTMVGALAVGLPLPLLPVQILWINLVTDTTMVIPLGMEPAEGEAMKRPPRDPKRPILGKAMLWRVGILALVMAITTLAIFMYFWQSYPVAYARTIAFNALVVMQWANAFNSRREWESIFGASLFKNGIFYLGLLISIGLQAFVVFGPYKHVMHLVDVQFQDLWISCILAVTIVIVVGELHKFIGRRWFHK